MKKSYHDRVVYNPWMNQVVGIEVLDLKRRVPKGDLKQLKVLVA